MTTTGSSIFKNSGRGHFGSPHFGQLALGCESIGVEFSFSTNPKKLLPTMDCARPRSAGRIIFVPFDTATSRFLRSEMTRTLICFLLNVIQDSLGGTTATSILSKCETT